MDVSGSSAVNNFINQPSNQAGAEWYKPAAKPGFLYQTFVSDPVNAWTGNKSSTISAADVVETYAFALFLVPLAVVSLAGCSNRMEEGCAGGPGWSETSTDMDPPIGQVIPYGTPRTYTVRGIDVSCGTVQKDVSFSCDFGKGLVPGSVVYNDQKKEWDGVITHAFTKDENLAGGSFSCYLIDDKKPDKTDWKLISFNTTGAYDSAPATPSLNFEPNENLKLGDPINFTSNCDPDDTCQWLFGDGSTTFDHPDATGNSATHTYNVLSPTVQVRALKKDGLYSQPNQRTLYLSDKNSALIPATAINVFPNENLQVCRTSVEISVNPDAIRLTSEVAPTSDPNIQLQWSVDGQMITGSLADVAKINVTFKTPGNKNFTLQGKASGAAEWTLLYSGSLYVNDKGAAPVYLPIPAEKQPEVGDQVTYTATAVPGEKTDNLTYRWTFPDGTKYPADGSYTAKASVDYIWNMAGTLPIILDVRETFPSTNTPDCVNYYDYTITGYQSVGNKFTCTPALVYRDAPKISFQNPDKSPNIYECVTNVKLLMNGIGERIFSAQNNNCVLNPDPGKVKVYVAWDGNLAGNSNGAQLYTIASSEMSVDPKGGLMLSANHVFTAAPSQIQVRLANENSNDQRDITIGFPDLPTILEKTPNAPATDSLVLEGGTQYSRVAGETIRLRPQFKLPGASYTWMINGLQYTPSAADKQADPDGALISYTIPSDKSVTAVTAQVIVTFPVFPPGGGDACYSQQIASNTVTIPVNPCQLRIDGLKVTPNASSTAVLAVRGQPDQGTTITLSAVNPTTCGLTPADPNALLEWRLGGATDISSDGTVNDTLAAVGTLNVKYYDAAASASLWDVSDPLSPRQLGSVSLPFLKNADAPSVVLKGNTVAFANEPAKFSAAIPGDTAGRYQFSWDFGDKQTAQGGEVSHRFALDAGYNYAKYPVTLTVTDTQTGAATPYTIYTEVYTRQLQASIIGVDNADVDTPVKMFIDPAYVDPAKYTIAWDFGDKQTARGNEVNHTYTTIGDYAAVAKIYNKADYDADPAGAQPVKIATHNVNIHSAGAPNLVGQIPSSASTTDTSVLFSAKSLDPNATISWQLSYLDKNGAEQKVTKTADFLFDFSQVKPDSEVEVVLTAKNADGNVNRITRTLHVYPTALMLNIYGDQVGYVGSAINLSGVTNGSGLNYKWTIINQNTGTTEDFAGDTLSYTPATQGTYTFRFVATDTASGKQYTRDQIIGVYAPPTNAQPPLATINTGYSVAKGGTLTLSASTLPANCHLSWRVLLPTTDNSTLLATAAGNSQAINLADPYYAKLALATGVIELTVTDPATGLVRIMTQNLSIS